MRSTLNRNLDFQQAVEFLGKIDRDPRVHGSLLVEKTLFALERENSFMPDVGMDVEPLASVAEESDEILGLDIVSRVGEWAEMGIYPGGKKADPRQDDNWRARAEGVPDRVGGFHRIVQDPLRSQGYSS